MNQREVSTSQSAEAFEKLFQFATVGIVVINTRGSIELINMYAENLFGYSLGELVGQPLELLLPKSLKMRHVSLRDGFMKEPKTRTMGKGMTLFACRKDGTEFPVEISLSHYIMHEELKAVAFISDITERRMVEQKLESLTVELEEKVKLRTLELEAALEVANELNEMKSTFISMASHEFRTPLTTLLSSVNLIEIYIIFGRIEETPKHFERIKDSINRLTYILNDFLSVDKVKEGIAKPTNRLFNLKEFIERIIDEVSELRRDCHEIVYIHQGDLEILLDEEMLHNILLNLVSNAIKYSDSTVEIKSLADDKEIMISVKDKGIGISQEDQKHIFEKFYRAESVNVIQGTGIGLNIVQRYIELLEGTIDIQSKIGEGSVFKVIFKKKAIK